MIQGFQVKRWNYPFKEADKRIHGLWPPLIKTPSWVLYSLCELGQNRTILINLLHQLMQNISTLIIFDTCINWKKKITGNFVNIKDLMIIKDNNSEILLSCQSYKLINIKWRGNLFCCWLFEISFSSII